MPGEIVYAEPGHFGYPEDNETPMDGPAQLGSLALRLAALRSGLTTAQRDALAGTDLWPGRRIWNNETQRTEEYTGSAWRAIGSIDLDAHEAETDPHTGYVRKALATAKGDLLVASASGVIARRGVGADGHALVADSAEATGVRWADLSGTYLAGQVIDHEVLASPAASLVFASIPATFAHLLLVWDARSTRAATSDGVQVRLNGDSSASYDWQKLRAAGAAASAQEALAQSAMEAGLIAAASAAATLAGTGRLWIPNYAATTFHKSLFAQSSTKIGTASGNLFAETHAGFWRSTAAVSGLTVFAGSGSLAAGTTVTLIGLES